MVLKQGTLSVRRMVYEDLDAVLVIQGELGFQEWTQAHFLTEIKNFNDCIPLVLEYDTIVSGYMVLKVMGDEAELCSIAVRKSKQAMGLATLLLRQGLEMLWIRGVCQVFLEVRKGNTYALGLYRKMGFTEVGERKRYYPDGEDALVMVMKNVLDA
jgi:ribosomal-protein-alanine N-acetyltransferase